MITSAHVRELLGQAEDFLRGGDPYGAMARARDAARQVASVRSHDGAEVRQEVALALDRFGAAEHRMREDVERRHALHVANERRAAGITDEALLERASPSRTSRFAEFVGWIARKRTRRVERRAVEV